MKNFLTTLVFLFACALCSAQVGSVCTGYERICLVDTNGWNKGEIGYASYCGYVLSAGCFNGDTLRIVLGRTKQQAVRTITDLSIFRLNGVEYDRYTVLDTDGNDVQVRVARKDGIGMLHIGGYGDDRVTNTVDCVAIRCNYFINEIENFKE